MNDKLILKNKQIKEIQKLYEETLEEWNKSCKGDDELNSILNKEIIKNKQIEKD